MIQTGEGSVVASASDVFYTWLKGTKRKARTHTSALHYERTDAFLYDISHDRLPCNEYLKGSSQFDGTQFDVAVRIYRPECALVIVPQQIKDCTAHGVYVRMLLREVTSIKNYIRDMIPVIGEVSVAKVPAGFDLIKQRVVVSATPHDMFNPDCPVFFRTIWTHLLYESVGTFTRASRARSKHLELLKSACASVEYADLIQEFVVDQSGVGELRNKVDASYRSAKARLTILGR